MSSQRLGKDVENEHFFKSVFKFHADSSDPSAIRCALNRAEGSLVIEADNRTRAIVSGPSSCTLLQCVGGPSFKRAAEKRCLEMSHRCSLLAIQFHGDSPVAVSVG